MKAPMICPACGELVIAWLAGDTLRLLPDHPDRVQPDKACTTSLVTFGNQPTGPTGKA